MKFRFAIREEDGRRVEGRHAIVNCDILRRSRSQLRGKYFREMLRARQFSNARLEKRREKEEKSLSLQTLRFFPLFRGGIYLRDNAISWRLTDRPCYIIRRGMNIHAERRPVSTYKYVLESQIPAFVTDRNEID